MTEIDYTRKRFDLVSYEQANVYSSKSDHNIMSDIFMIVKREGAENLLQNLILFGTDNMLLSTQQRRILLFMDYLQSDDLNKVFGLILKLKTQRIMSTPLCAPLPRRCK